MTPCRPQPEPHPCLIPHLHLRPIWSHRITSPFPSQPRNHLHPHPSPLSLRALPSAKHRVYLHRRSTRSRPRLSHAGTCHTRWHSGAVQYPPRHTGAFLGSPSWEEGCWVQLDSPFLLLQHGISFFSAEVQMWMPRIRDLPPGEICSVPSPGETPTLSLAGMRGGGGREVRWGVPGCDLGSVLFHLCSQDSHEGGTGAFIPFYLKLPRIPWRGKSIPGSPAKPVALGKRGDKGPGTDVQGQNPWGSPQVVLGAWQCCHSGIPPRCDSATLGR